MQQQKKKNFRKRSSVQEEEVEGEENSVKSDDEQERRYPSLSFPFHSFFWCSTFIYLVGFLYFSINVQNGIGGSEIPAETEGKEIRNSCNFQC